MSVRSLFSSGRSSIRPASGAAGGGLALDRGAPLTVGGFEAACAALGVDAPRLLAVMGIEAMGCGFLADRRPVILFERHVFHRRTAGRFDARDPDISAPRPGLYGPAGAHQHARLARARVLDEAAALESASWGLGQVMGFNARLVGFADVRAMVAAMEAGEDAQLSAMVAYIRATGLAPALARGDWRAFARATTARISPATLMIAGSPRRIVSTRRAGSPGPISIFAPCRCFSSMQASRPGRSTGGTVRARAARSPPSAPPTGAAGRRRRPRGRRIGARSSPPSRQPPSGRRRWTRIFMPSRGRNVTRWTGSTA